MYVYPTQKEYCSDYDVDVNMNVCSSIRNAEPVKYLK